MSAGPVPPPLTLPMYLLMLVAVVVGLCVGSFLNVVIYRLPRGLSVIRPGSKCPYCDHPIPPHLNVPILSYLILGGRCRWCGQRIRWRYVVVEALTAGVFALLAVRFAHDPIRVVAGAVFAGSLIAIAFIDLDHGIVPDRITLPGLIVGILLSVLREDLTLWQALLGVLVCGGFFWLVVVVSRGGMGGGDVKLGGMIGAFCGWKVALVASFGAVVSGGLVGAALMLSGRKGRRDTIPFGPFLALGALLAYVWGDTVLAWYQGLWLPVQ